MSTVAGRALGRDLLVVLCVAISLPFLSNCSGYDGGEGQVETLAFEGDLPDGIVGTGYDATLTAKRGTDVVTAEWQVASNGALPTGLVLDGGRVTGTPTTAGSYSFSVRATQAGETVSRAFDVTIAAAPGGGPVITAPLANQALPPGTVSVPYTFTFAGTGGTTPYTWELTSGTLPAGLHLDAATGMLDGTPTAAVVATPLVVRLRAGATQTSVPTSLTIAEAPASLEVVTPDPFPDAIVGQAFTFQAQAAGGVRPYTWRAVSGLPTGLVIGGASGTIAGTPTATSAPGNQVQLEVTGGTVVTRSRRFEALAPLQLFQQVFTATPLAVNQPIVPRNMDPRGGRTPFQYDLNPGSAALPTGLVLNGTTGQISGTPTVIGTTDVVVRVRDNSRIQHAGAVTPQSATTTVHLVIVPAPATLTVALAGAGGGVVQGGGINCVRSTNQTSGTCTITSTVGASITLTPSPDAASLFTGWQGCGATTAGPCTITLSSAATTVTGTFGVGMGTVRLRPMPSFFRGAGVYFIDVTWSRPGSAATIISCRVTIDNAYVQPPGNDPYLNARTGDCDLELPADATVVATIGSGTGFEAVYDGRLQRYRYVPQASPGTQRLYTIVSSTETDCGVACEVHPIRDGVTTIAYASQAYARSYLAPRGNNFVRIYSPGLYLDPANPNLGFKYDCRWETATGPQSGRCVIDAPMGSSVLLNLITLGPPAGVPDIGSFCYLARSNLDYSITECEHIVGRLQGTIGPASIPTYTPYAWEPLVTYP